MYIENDYLNMFSKAAYMEPLQVHFEPFFLISFVHKLLKHGAYAKKHKQRIFIGVIYIITLVFVCHFSCKSCDFSTT